MQDLGALPKSKNVKTYRYNDTALIRRLSLLEARMKTVEHSQEDYTELVAAVKKTAHRVKIWGPAIASAAVTSGIVSGRWGAFLHALFQ